jgi:hypothetical protein
MFEQMLDGEVFGEIRTGRFARAGRGVRIKLTRTNRDFILVSCEPILSLRCNGQVGRRNRKLVFQQPFVNGAELADAKTPEIYRAPSLGCLIDEEKEENRTEIAIAELTCARASPSGEISLSLRNRPLVGGNAPFAVALIDRIEELVDLFPERVAPVESLPMLDASDTFALSSELR